MKHIAYLGLGSNQGERDIFLYRALQELTAHPKINVVKCSSIYETDPYGPVPQPDFLNMVIEIETALSPIELLNATQHIEAKLDRKREVRWGPRTIDLDILLYNQENIKMEKLQIPHVELIKRAFVVLPLYEIAPNLKISNNGELLSTLHKKFSDSKGVRLWKQNNGGGEFGLFES